MKDGSLSVAKRLFTGEAPDRPAPGGSRMSLEIAPGHIGLSVTDLDRSLAFYQDVLNLDVLQRSEAPGRFAFLGAGGRLFLTLWQQSGAGYEPRHAGLHHLAFQVPTLEEV